MATLKADIPEKLSFLFEPHRYKGKGRPGKDITYTIEGECWCCDSHALDTKGYPTLHRKGCPPRIHRYSYEIHNGKIPPGMSIRHTCDNRKCINPAHLVVGTNDDNIADRVERGRSAVGESNGRSKLLIEDVEKILADNETPYKELAKRYKVVPSVISCINRGITWKCVSQQNNEMSI